MYIMVDDNNHTSLLHFLNSSKIRLVSLNLIKTIQLHWLFYFYQLSDGSNNKYTFIATVSFVFSFLPLNT